MAVARRVFIIGLICVAIVIGSALLGPSWPNRDEWGDLSSVFWRLRAPRVLIGALAGAGLALGGVVLQTIFQNPLASPFTLGIASGASLGAAIAFLLGLTGSVLWMPMLTLCAFAGALAAISAVYLLARLQPTRNLAVLLLAGVCISYLCSAAIMLAIFLAQRPVANDIVIWMIGSLDRHRPIAALEIGLLLVPALVVVIASHRGFDLLQFDDDVAAARGVAVDRVVWAGLLLVGALTAMIAANCGPVAFVGLLVPHIARILIGHRTLPLAITAVLLGAAFLTLCDGIVRTFHPSPPVGVATNILGAGFFFYLLAVRAVGK